MSGRRQQLLQDIDDDEQSWSHRDLLNATAAVESSAGKVPSLLSKETSTDSDDDGGGLLLNQRSTLPTTIGSGSRSGRPANNKNIQSPGASSSSRMSMSGKIESYDAVLSSSLPLHDDRQKSSAVEEDGGAASSSMVAAMERRIRQLEEMNQNVVSQLQLQLAKETERSQKLQDTCEELKNQVKELWYELGQERSQRKQLVTSIQQGQKPRHSFRGEAGGGDNDNKNNSKNQAAEKGTTKPNRSKPLPRQLQNATTGGEGEDDEEEEIVYTPEVLNRMKQDAIKRVSSRERMATKPKKRKSSSGTNDGENEDEVYYTSEVLSNMKQEAIERLSMKSDAMSNASSSRRSRQFVYADTDDEDEEENVVYTPEVLNAMKQEAIKRVSSGEGLRASSSSTAAPEPPPKNGCAVCCRMICILIGVIIMMVGLIAGSYYIGKETFPQREAIATLPPTIIETLVPTTTTTTAAEEESAVETLAPTTIETSGNNTSNLMVQSDVVLAPVDEITEAVVVQEEGEGGNEESTSSNNGLMPVRQRGGLGRSLQSNAVP